MTETHKLSGGLEDAYAAQARAIEIANAKPKNSAAVYWVGTLRGNQPRCQKCNHMLTVGPHGGPVVVEAECPGCRENLRDNGASSPVERRAVQG